MPPPKSICTQNPCAWSHRETGCLRKIPSQADALLMRVGPDPLTPESVRRPHGDAETQERTAGAVATAQGATDFTWATDFTSKSPQSHHLTAGWHRHGSGGQAGSGDPSGAERPRGPQGSPQESRTRPPAAQASQESKLGLRLGSQGAGSGQSRGRLAGRARERILFFFK